MPAGFTGELRGHGSTFRAVVIQGRIHHGLPGATDVAALVPGSYFGAKGASVHQVSCAAGEECALYVRMDGTFDLIAAQTEM